MKKGTIAIIVIVLVIILGIWLFSSGSGSNSTYSQNDTNTTQANNNTNNTNTSPAPAPAQNANSGQLFSTSRYAKYAYLISTSVYDAKTKEALSGFTVTKKTLSDGSEQITLNAKNVGYQTQVYTVKPGEKLYFIETSFGDDGNNRDEVLGDDHAILVDASGYIVNK